MPRVFVFELSEEKPCPKCRKRVSKVFVLAASYPRAVRNLNRINYLCGLCLAQELAESKAQVRFPKYKKLISKRLKNQQSSEKEV